MCLYTIRCVTMYLGCSHHARNDHAARITWTDKINDKPDGKLHDEHNAPEDRFPTPRDPSLAVAFARESVHVMRAA